MNGAQWFVRTLKDVGVEQVFVLCGNGLNPFLDACLDYRMKIIDVRNGQAASYLAETWGRFTRRFGVIAVSSGEASNRKGHKDFKPGKKADHRGRGELGEITISQRADRCTCLPHIS
jgi:hypothetical protein